MYLNIIYEITFLQRNLNLSTWYSRGSKTYRGNLEYVCGGRLTLRPNRIRALRPIRSRGTHGEYRIIGEIDVHLIRAIGREIFIKHSSWLTVRCVG